MTVLLRLLITAVALWGAATFIDGIRYTGSTLGLVGLSLLFGPQSISGKGDGPPQWQKGPGRRCSGRRASHCPGPADREPGPYAEQVQQQGAVSVVSPARDRGTAMYMYYIAI